MKLNKALYTVVLFWIVTVSYAQILPPIETYLPENYGGENQNWSISQSANKFIYVANNKGLLEFNGSKWQLYPSPNESIMRSVEVIDEHIYTGCYMEFGYWKKNQLGTLDYTSLSQSLKIDLIEDEQFWNIINVGNFVVFQSLNRLYLYNTTDKSFEILYSQNTITKVFKVNKSLYFQKLNEGLFKFENGEAVSIIDHPTVNSNIIINIFESKGQLLIETQNDGFYFWINNQLQKWVVGDNAVIDSLSVYNSIMLADGTFMLGTISNGLYNVSEDGVILSHITQSIGLANNTILSLFEDIDNNVWLGLDNGINCINKNSPISIYNDQSGSLGTVYASIIFNNFLYLGTNQGLFYKPLIANSNFKFINGTNGQVWCLENLDSTLFCGHNNGTYIIDENNTAKLVAADPGTWTIKPLDFNKKLMIQGNYNGLNILQKIDGIWSFRNKLDGFDISSKYLEILNDTTFFVNHEYKGVFRIIVDTSYATTMSVHKEVSVDKGANSSLLKYKDNIVYANKKGVYTYSQALNKFAKDTILSGLYKSDEYTSGKLVPDYSSNLWSFSSKEITYLSPGELVNLPTVNRISIPKSLRKEMVGYENISHVEDRKYLFGTSTGYIVIDLDKIKDNTYEIRLNSVKNFAIDYQPVFIRTDTTGYFENKHNNIEFNFSIAEYDKFQEVEYQHVLIGYQNQFSKWQNSSSVLYKNLPFGSYEFRVKAKIGHTISDNSSSYKFEIKKPWYLTNIMIVVYIGGVLLFSVFMHNVYIRYYKKQKEKLLVRNKQELDLKQLESDQQLMLLKNDKLNQDIQNKNRELAISTMSLIKKNEFLNTIKGKLKDSKDDSHLRSVIKIIDKNLNNTDDWKFFEEAFNNADKDFLKKVKSKHATLTSNDLRLCAYLRLNLSSKEIAPLLNISPKSVEVKRYRLRKKMNLNRDDSLTDYILQI